MRISAFGFGGPILTREHISPLMSESTLILDASAIQRALARIAHEIVERNEAGSEVVMVGINAAGCPWGSGWVRY